MKKITLLSVLFFLALGMGYLLQSQQAGLTPEKKAGPHDLPLATMVSAINEGTPFSYLNKDLHSDWLESDRRSMRLLRNLIPPKKVDDFIKNLGVSNIDLRTNSDIGFGGRRISLLQSGGGYIAPWVSILSYKGNVVQLQVEWGESVGDEHWPVIKKELQKIWGDGLVDRGNSYRYFFVDQKQLFKFYKSVAQALGMRSEANIPEELKKSYDLLISPLNFTDVGCDCYEGGENPDGFMAVRKLYKAD